MRQQKRKITRKRNREWKQLSKKILIFISVFCITLGFLFIIFRESSHLMTPLSLIKAQKAAVVESTQDTSVVKKALDAKKIEYDEINVSSEGAYMVRLKTGEDVILSSEKDLAKQLSSLQVIYSRLTMEGRGLRKLDLRYDKPVVVFK
jgi:cell division septal protein FtsQ